MSHREQTEAIVEVHFRLTPSSRKFDSPENRKLIIERVQTYGIFPSDTGVLRAISELVSEESIERVDGGNPETDAEAAHLAEQVRLDRIAAQPLTERDFDLFVRITPDELGKKYYGDVEFRVRYDAAIKTWGFRKPAPPRRVFA